MNRALWELRQSLKKARAKLGWTVAGWRPRKSIALPFVANFGDGAPDSQATMRPWPPDQRVRYAAVGDPPPDMIDFIRQKKREGEVDLQKVLIELIRRRADESRGVGKDLMSVLITPPDKKLVTVEYFPWKLEPNLFVVGKNSPTREINASYTPWIITPFGYQPPLKVAPGCIFESAGYRFECKGPQVSLPPGILFAATDQDRKPMPR